MKVQSDQYFAIIPESVLYADISSAAVRVFATLNRYANSDTGKCHPSRATIAKKCHINIKTVDRAMQELVNLGVVRVDRRKVDGTDEYTSNEYTIIMSLGGVKMGPPWGKNDATGRDKNGSQIKAIENQRKEPSISSSLDDGFDEFWANYPRKVAKKAALKAWRIARKEAQKEDIIAGVILYAIMRRDEDPRFTPHASTWLNQGRWADETMIDRPEPETPKPIIPAWEPCGNCHGGWVYATDDRGYETAHPCICRP